MGIVPNSIPLPAGPARSLSLSAVSGSITPLAGSAAFGADGGNFFNLPYTVLPHAGIAGINDPDIGFTMPLVGVFTSGVPLQASRPANRTVATDKELGTVPTVLNQPFFLGDGVTSLGVRQLFMAPDGASHFSFGFADAIPQFGIYHGPPGNYSDNAGALTITYAFIPEPSAGVLFFLGLTLPLIRKRKTPDKLSGNIFCCCPLPVGWCQSTQVDAGNRFGATFPTG